MAARSLSVFPWIATVPAGLLVCGGIPGLALGIPGDPRIFPDPINARGGGWGRAGGVWLLLLRRAERCPHLAGGDPELQELPLGHGAAQRSSHTSPGSLPAVKSHPNPKTGAGIIPNPPGQ